MASSISHLIALLKERKSVVFSGVPEPIRMLRPSERVQQDMSAVQKILDELNLEVYPIAALRLGKYKLGETRPLKVSFSSLGEQEEVLAKALHENLLRLH